MRLGEAYVNVRADLKPYYRDLQVGLRETTAAFEKQLNKQLGRKFGKEISTGAREELVEGAKKISKDIEKELGGSGGNDKVRRGMRRSTRKGLEEGFFDALSSGQKLFTFIASSLASALDDGISALPVEIKAALAAGLAAVAPVLIAQFGTILAAGIAVGTAGLGIALAAQLQPVQEAFADILTRVRNSAAGAAGPLVEPLIRGLEYFANFVEKSIAPRLESIFTVIGPGIEALVKGATVAIDQIFAGLQAGSGDIDGLLRELADAFIFLGVVIGDSFRILLSTGRDGRAVLRDLVAVIGATVLGISALAAVLADAYGYVRDIGLLLKGDIAGFYAAQAADQLEKVNNAAFVTENAYRSMTVATDAETKALDAQTKALKANQKALDDVVKSADDYITTQIDAEEARDALTEALKKNGRTLDLDTEKGRDNARKTQDFLNDIRDSLIARVEQGDLTAEAAEAQFNQEVAALEKVYGKTKTTKEEFHRLFDAMIAASKARLDPSPWVTAFTAIGKAARDAIARIRELSRVAAGVRGPASAPGSASSRGGGGGTPYADGGRITRPTYAMMGEGYQPELVLPETKPARAAQILAGSPLGNMLGGQTVVYAYFDGEPFQARIVQTTRNSNNRTARNIAQVPRSL